MREAFIDKKFQGKSLEVIKQANNIIASYQAQGFTLTLRQLYYQFVSRDLIQNKQTEYKRLGQIINDARLAGMIDWKAIEDRTRNVKNKEWGFRDPEQGIDWLAEQYAEFYWPKQPRHVEVWIEKDALVGVIEPVCLRWRLPYLACRGYVSQSEQYDAGKRFARMDGQGRRSIVLYLGDHDPSGMDMTRDHVDRLAMFARWPVEVKRLALNMDQIDQYDPPPNPAKESDSRAVGYIDEYGDSSWELDALEPTVIDALIEDELQELIDHDAWQASEAAETESRKVLTAISLNFSDVEEYMRSNGMVEDGEEPEE